MFYWDKRPYLPGIVRRKVLNSITRYGLKPDGLKPYGLEPRGLHACTTGSFFFFFTNSLEFSIGRDFGAPKGLNRMVLNHL